ncbi:MAG: hypothetical protein V1890_02600 [Candidatus Zixiibacteriota bacterium]
MNWTYLLILVTGYLFCFIFGSMVVRFCIRKVDPSYKTELGKPVVDTGLIIGLCESFITISLVLMDALTGLAIIFTAKSIARSKKIEEKAEFYLVGTMVNFSFSLLVGILLKRFLEFFN